MAITVQVVQPNPERFNLQNYLTEKNSKYSKFQKLFGIFISILIIGLPSCKCS